MSQPRTASARGALVSARWRITWSVNGTRSLAGSWRDVEAIIAGRYPTAMVGASPGEGVVREECGRVVASVSSVALPR